MTFLTFLQNDEALTYSPPQLVRKSDDRYFLYLRKLVDDFFHFSRVNVQTATMTMSFFLSTI